MLKKKYQFQLAHKNQQNFLIQQIQLRFDNNNAEQDKAIEQLQQNFSNRIDSLQQIINQFQQSINEYVQQEKLLKTKIEILTTLASQNRLGSLTIMVI